MTTISDKDRAEVEAMLEAAFGRSPALIVLSDDDVRRWLAVRDHVLAAHECPTVLGLERGDLLAAAGCLHRYRQPHMVALVARLSEAEHRAAQARAALGGAGGARIEQDPNRGVQ